MQRQYEQCKEMMEVTDEELDVYRVKRTQLESTISDKEMEEKTTYEILQFQKTVDETKEKQKLKYLFTCTISNMLNLIIN